MKENIAIKVSHVNKSFKVPHEKHSSLKAAAVNIFSTKKYTKFKALEDIDFEIKKGEFFGIVGKNGSGKSTLLKILANIYQPNGGKVEINGTLAPFIELGVGFNVELTGRENVFLSGTILGMKKKKIEQIYDEIVAFAEIEEFMDQKLKNYSSGMQVRLAFSIAVRAESDILLIDEVLAVGDSAFQAKCFDYFYKLKESNKTIVFVSHDMDSVKKFCDKAIYISDGNIKAQGNTEVVADKYSIDNYRSLRQNPEEETKGNKKSKIPVIITNYKLKNDIIKKDEPIVLSIEVAAKLVQKLILGISITREDGVYVADFNSKTELGEIKTKKGKNIFECSISPNQLAASRYVVNVAIFDPRGFMLIDALSDQARFKVMNTTESKGGVFNIDGTWKVIK